MKYKAILFDMDGTLIETNGLWDVCTRDALKKCNIVLSEDELISLRSVLIHDLMAGKGYSEEDIANVKSLRDGLMMGHLDMISWIADARNLLSSIAAPKAIVTSSPRHMFQAFDQALRISSFFEHIVTGDDVKPEYKPHPKGLLMACEALGVLPADCVFIGDQIVDLQAAEAAGMPSILTHGTYTPTDLHQSSEVFSLPELKAYLF